MQANVKEAKRPKEIDDRDDDPSDTFNYMVSKDSISDNDLDDFVHYFGQVEGAFGLFGNSIGTGNISHC